MGIECRSCMAVDALCALAAGSRCRRSVPAGRAIASSVSGKIGALPSAWVLSSALSGHLSINEIEKLTLSDLVDCLPARLTDNEFTARTADSVAEGLVLLENLGFEKLWQEQCLPYLDEWNTLLEDSLSRLPLQDLERELKRLCPDKPRDSLRIYLCFYAYPFTFPMSDRILVTSCRIGSRPNAGQLLSRMIHELVHGSFSPASLDLYRGLCHSDSFLTRTNSLLTTRWRGLSEEEFVSGITAFLTVKYCGIRREEIVKKLTSGCGWTMPFALVLFDRLLKLDALPEDMDGWLTRFITGLSDAGFSTVLNAVSPGYEKNFDKVNRKEAFSTRMLML